SERAFRGLAEVGLLEPISSELHVGASDPLWKSLAALDGYRRQFESTPDTLSNAILLGSLLVPLGISLHPPRIGVSTRSTPDVLPMNVGLTSDGNQIPVGSGSERDRSDRSQKPRRPPIPRLGDLPLARRDVERLRQIVGLQRRLRDV